MTDKNMLQNVYLFRDLVSDEVSKVSAIAEVETFAPGDEIFEQGDKAVALYVIRYGSVRIAQQINGDTVEIAVLGTGSHFGEMALLDGEDRSATVKAAEKTEIIRFDFEKLNAVLTQYPGIAVKFYRSLAHFLGGRLRLTTRDLSFARERNLQFF